MDDLFELMMESEQIATGRRRRRAKSAERETLDKSYLREALGNGILTDSVRNPSPDWADLDHALAAGVDAGPTEDEAEEEPAAEPDEE